MARLPVPGSDRDAWGQILNDYLAVSHNPDGTQKGAALAYGTTLPASPINGQEAILVDSITNPSYQWRFRYNAGSTSAYKWEFVGGSEYWQQAASGTYQALPAGQSAQPPIFVTPRAGDWIVRAFGQFTGGTVGSVASLGAGTTAVALPQPSQSLAVANHHFSIAAEVRISSVPQGQQISIWINASHPDLLSANRVFTVLPARLA
jgi:hypothetical protein